MSIEVWLNKRVRDLRVLVMCGIIENELTSRHRCGRKESIIDIDEASTLLRNCLGQGTFLLGRGDSLCSGLEECSDTLGNSN